MENNIVKLQVSNLFCIEVIQNLIFKNITFLLMVNYRMSHFFFVNLQNLTQNYNNIIGNLIMYTCVQF